MTGVKHRGYFAAAVAVLGAALVAALFAAPPDRPVDIRLVAPPPPTPETITATATTTVSAVGPVALTTVPPPPPPSAARPLPRQSPAPTKPSAPPPSSKPRDFFDFLRCDYKYFDNDFERCLPWPLSPKELCQYVKDHHLDLIDVRGPDGHELDDLDFDCD